MLLLFGVVFLFIDLVVVFLVFGKCEIFGCLGMMFEGELGVNDLVGIVIMVSLLVVIGMGMDVVVGGFGMFVL